jgi:protein gp37
MAAEWVDRIEKMCRKTGAAFFFKQWGGVKKAKAGRTRHGRTYDEMPENRVGG